MISNTVIASLIASSGIAAAAVTLPSNADLIFKFDYSIDTIDTPSINKTELGWEHWESEVPNISGGVAHFSNGGPYTASAYTFNADAFTIDFNIANVANTDKPGFVMAIGDGAAVTGNPGLAVLATTTSLILQFQGAEVGRIDGLSLGSSAFTNLTISNSQTGGLCFYANGEKVGSFGAISGTVNAQINIGSRVNESSESSFTKLTGDMTNISLYSKGSVPEPATASLGLLALSALMLRRRRG